MKKPTRPKEDGTVNRAELARLMRVSLPTIDDWQRRGCPSRSQGARGRSYGFNVQDVIEWRVKDERRRQGLPPALAADDPNGDKFPLGYNPLRQISYNSVRSFMKLALHELALEDMVDDVRKHTSCDERAARMAVGSICYFQWMLWAKWVREDWFNRACDQDLDDVVLKMNSRAKFIRGPIPDEKIENGEHVPDAVHNLLSELFAGRPGKDEAATKGSVKAGQEKP